MACSISWSSSHFVAQISNFYFCIVKFRFFFFYLLDWFQSNDFRFFILFMLFLYLLIGNLFNLDEKNSNRVKWPPFRKHELLQRYFSTYPVPGHFLKPILYCVYWRTLLVLIPSINIRSASQYLRAINILFHEFSSK